MLKWLTVANEEKISGFVFVRSLFFETEQRAQINIPNIQYILAGLTGSWHAWRNTRKNLVPSLSPFMLTSCLPYCTSCVSYDWGHTREGWRRGSSLLTRETWNVGPAGRNENKNPKSPSMWLNKLPQCIVKASCQSQKLKEKSKIFI